MMNPTIPNAASIEDVLAGAMWVSNLTDPTLVLDRLHETFMEVIFSFAVTDAAGAAEGDVRRPRFRTQAERERERAELLQGVMELEAGPLQSADEDDDEPYGTDEEDTGDGDDEEGLIDREFLDWISPDGGAEPRSGTLRTADTQISTAELELNRVGLGEDQAALAVDRLPERFKELALEEHRPGLGPRRLPGGFTYELPIEQEAYWILRQLRRPGQPLSHNTDICVLSNRPRVEIADDPVLVSIAFAIEKMTRDYLEPSQLMLFHQTPLHPLLSALLRDSPLSEEAEHVLASPSYAYSSLTGRRQRPVVTRDYVGFSAVASRPIGDGDPKWRTLHDNRAATQRKPCFIELGRLLVRILELDSLCHRLEARRQGLLLMLRDSPDARVQEQRAILEDIVFESAVEANIWHTYVESLTVSRPTTHFHRVRELGLEDAFEEYTITGFQYQENLMQNARINACPSPRLGLHEWADNVGASVSRSGDAILALFNDVVVEQFLKLPVLCKRLVDVFYAEGALIVTYRGVERNDSVYPLTAFFVDHAAHYVELLEDERQGRVELHYVLDYDLVRRLLNTRQLYHQDDNEWSKEREAAIEVLVIRLVETLVPQVKAELLQQARYYLDAASVQRLGSLCCQGPYEATRLCLESYDEHALTWEPEWNVVEALPAADNVSLRLRARVCAAFRASNGVTLFTFIDEYGSLLGSVRWLECALHSITGRETFFMQNAQLEKAFREYTPAVVAVAAFEYDSLATMRTVQRFVRERACPALGVSVPVVWASAEVARYYSTCEYAQLETPTFDHLARVSLALARYTQDPLITVATLFDRRRTVMQLCRVGTARLTSDASKLLYRRLCWEMSLWTSGCGFWVDDCSRRPNSGAALQFVAGLGVSKSQVLLQKWSRELPGSRPEVREALEDLFGPLVAANATNVLRVPVPGTQNAASGYTSHAWSPLDQTLIPLEWYPAALYAAQHAMQTAPGGVGFVDLVTFTSKHATEKRMLFAQHADQRSLSAQLKTEDPDLWRQIRGEREIELIAEELIALGRSFLRRPYRRLSTVELMLQVTGNAFVLRADIRQRLTPAIDGTAPVSHAGFFCQGDYLEGLVGTMRGGTSPGIHVTTSGGLKAFLPASNVPDEALRLELLEHVRRLEAVRDARRRGADAALQTIDTPAWLRRGALIQGTVHACNWGACELILRWCAPRETDMTRDAGGAIQSYAAIIKLAKSNASSLNSAVIEANQLSSATKAARHPLFRTISKAEAKAQLLNKEIGEIILRPDGSGRRNSVACVVKSGANCTCTWRLEERRRANGVIYYFMKDTVPGCEYEFDAVDEFLRNYVQQAMQLINSIRSHRRFVDSPLDVPGALKDQEHAGLTFAYAFTEVATTTKAYSYCVYTRGGNREYKFPLHITDTNVLVRLPFSVGGSLKFKWLQCRNAEEVSKAVKRHAGM